MAGCDLTAHRVRELLDYDPETGVFTRKVWRGGTSRAGSIAGASHGKTGYLQISIDRRLCFAHRLAWLHYYGEHPEHHIDHINGVRDDNRIANLRDVPHAINGQNQRRARSDNRLGVLGVSKRRNHYTSHIWLDGKMIYLGFFNTVEEAHAAYLEAKRRLHEGCTI